MRKIIIIAASLLTLVLISTCDDAKTFNENIEVIFFTGNVGASQVETYLAVDANSLLVEPADPTRTGFDFIGWFTDPNATLPWDFTVDKVVEDSIVLYAGWDPSLFNIIYDLNGGDLPLTYPVDFYAGENKVLPLPTKAGFSFVAWYPYDWVDSSSTRAGDPGYQSLPAETYEDLYVYAHWDPVSVRVTFRANYPIEDEGPENPTTKMVNYGDPINFDTLADTAEYEFVGWNSSPSGTGTFYNNDDLFIRTQRITVYAIWLLIE